MYCNKCGSSISKNDKFCNCCGEKIILNTLEKKYDAGILNDYNIFKMFVWNLLLLVATLVISLIHLASDADESVGGWVIILMPFIIPVFIIPDCIGIVASKINIKKKSRGLLMFSFFISCFSLILIILSIKAGFNYLVLGLLPMIQCLILIGMCFWKLVKKK